MLINKQRRAIRLAEAMSGGPQTFIVKFYLESSDDVSPQEKLSRRLELTPEERQIMNDPYNEGASIGQAPLQQSKEEQPVDGMRVGIDYEGAEELLQKVNKNLGEDFLEKIETMANKTMPNECLDDYEYIKKTGLDTLKHIKGSDGSNVMDSVSAGFKVINKYVFNNDNLYVINDIPFMQVQFQVN